MHVIPGLALEICNWGCRSEITIKGHKILEFNCKYNGQNAWKQRQMSTKFERIGTAGIQFCGWVRERARKSAHFKKTVARILFLSKLWYFQYKSKQKVPQF